MLSSPEGKCRRSGSLKSPLGLLDFQLTSVVSGTITSKNVKYGFFCRVEIGSSRWPQRSVIECILSLTFDQWIEGHHGRHLSNILIT